MDLSIIIVNWNSKNYLRKCLDSIILQTKGIEYEIIVIDNASFDGASRMIQQYYPQVRFIQWTKNQGFAKANNIAFQKSIGSYLLFLNPDTEIIGSAINVMVDYLMQLQDIGILGCMLLNADRTVQTSCIQSYPSIFNQLLGSELLKTIWPKSSLWGMTPLFCSDKSPQEVEVISGACLMVKRTVFEMVKRFSEDYFMYAEDIDLCYKSKKAGYKNYYVPHATVIHHGGRSTSSGPIQFSVVMMRESVWRFLRKTRGRIYGFGYRLCMLFSAIVRMEILLIIFPFCMLRGRSASWKTSIRKWKAILDWCLEFKSV